MEKVFEDFLNDFRQKAIPLTKDLNLAYYNASISGNADDYARVAKLEKELTEIYADKKSFELLKEIKGKMKDPSQEGKRLLEVIYIAFLANQVDMQKLGKSIELSNQVEQEFATFRAELDGRSLTDNDIVETLENSTDSAELKKVWLASKEVGAKVAPKLKELVRLRNEIAQDLGFSNYQKMQLVLSEQEPEKIEALFAELDDLIRQPFALEKKYVDDILSKRYGVAAAELMPWHYQCRFFQEAPRVYEVNLDEYYQEKDIARIADKYYKGIGLDASDILERSDLYEKPGKNQHAYCISIDRENDVRVLENIKPNRKWMDTTLHELGHGVYDKFIPKSLPWELREPAHIFITEAIAIFFGEMSQNPNWMGKNLNIETKTLPDEKIFKNLRLEKLVFARWAQVMYRFEKSMYENPEQNLDDLWWNLVAKYQLLERPKEWPAGGWASKIHIATSPVYYHNYMLGNLFASQIKAMLKDRGIDQDFSEDPLMGSSLKEKIFHWGALYRWDEMIEDSMGEPLAPKYFANEFVNRNGMPIIQ